MTDLCAKIVGRHFSPAYRLAESQELKKAAAPAETAERRMIDLEGALRYQREEWRFRGTGLRNLAPDSAGGWTGRGVVLTGINNVRRDRRFYNAL
jgi:hypothetical protein